MSELDLIITNVSVVVPGEAEPQRLDIGVRDGKIVRLEAGLPADLADTVVDGGGKVAFPGVVDAHQHWGIYNPLRRGRRQREPRVGAGRRDDRAHLHAHRAVLPQQGRRLRRLLPRGAVADRGPRDDRLRLPPGPDEQAAHRGDPFPGRGSRRHLVQDLHVLRRPRAARPQHRPELLPDDARGRALRLRALRVRDARDPGGAGEVPRDRRPDLAVAALRDGRDHDGVHEARRGGRHADRPAGVQRLAPAALRGPRGHHRVVPRARDRAADDQPAAPDLAQGRRGGAADGATRSRTSTSAARSPSGTCSPTATPRTASAARSTRRCARARTSRRCGPT